MNTWVPRARKATLAVALCALLSGVGRSQHSGSGGSTFPSNGQSGLPSVVPPAGQSGVDGRNPAGSDGPQPGVLERQAKQRNDERQRRLVADTDKLLELATQLHTDVGKTDKNILSLDVVKRADEIEKLAHAVKERMKG